MHEESQIWDKPLTFDGQDVAWEIVEPIIQEYVSCLPLPEDEKQPRLTSIHWMVEGKNHWRLGGTHVRQILGEIYEVGWGYRAKALPTGLHIRNCIVITGQLRALHLGEVLHKLETIEEE